MGVGVRVFVCHQIIHNGVSTIFDGQGRAGPGAEMGLVGGTA